MKQATQNIMLLALVSMSPYVGASHACDSGESRQNVLLIKQEIEVIAKRYSIDPVMVQAVVKVESNFNTHAISTAGARGLMQLMPETQRELGVRDVFDVRENLDGGTRYLVIQILRFGNIRRALWAYNAGPSRVENNAVPRISHRYADKVLSVYDCYVKRSRRHVASRYIARLGGAH